MHTARAASSAKEVADAAETVMASLPSPQASRGVASEIAEGSRVKRFVDLSTVGRQTAIEVHDRRTVHPLEQLWIEDLLELFHGAAQDVSVAAGVDAHVITGSVDPLGLS